MNYAKSDLELMVGKNEKVLWRGKPNKRGFILEGIFNPLLPVALFWGLVDLTILGISLFLGNVPLVTLIFILVHLMPVWIYLAGMLFVFRKYKYIEYIITDKGVYISGGLFSYTCDMKPFTELARVNIHRGIVDQLIGVGDIVLTGNNVAGSMVIENIKDYKKVFELVKKLQEDIYTDTMYPNALRPEENPGFKTKYKG